MDESERAAIRDEGYSPDDPALVAALDRVRIELKGGAVLPRARHDWTTRDWHSTSAAPSGSRLLIVRD